MLNCEYREQVLYLSGQLQVHHLDGIKEDLIFLTGEEDPIQVDLSQVDDVDMAGLQIILAFLRSRKNATKLVGINPDLAKAISITGLEPHLAGYIE